MSLTRRQEEGLRIAVDRYNHKEPYTCISGYAGSGKSFLIKFIIQALDVDPEEEVAYVAYTGKAAQVLKQKGCPNATTAHKLLYTAEQNDNGDFFFIPKEEFDKEYKVIVVDEISMLPKGMWLELLSHQVYVLACGDPGQLPPINPKDDNHVLERPHIFLDEIMRQAKDSEIIRLSMHIREGKTLNSFICQEEQVRLLSSHEVVTGLYLWPDQIICATNNKRNKINNIVRSLKGFGPEPEPQDKIISLNNHWSTLSDQKTPLTNGSIGSLQQYSTKLLYLPKKISTTPVKVLKANFINEDGELFSNVNIDYKALTIGEKSLTPRQEYLMQHTKRCPRAPFDFAYGYAITGHKSQGSQWDKVLVFEEYFPIESEEHMRHLYTCCTRSAEKLVIVKK